MSKVEFTNEKFNPLSTTGVEPTINESIYGGYTPGRYFAQQQQPSIPMWDALSGKKQDMQGLRGVRDISADEQIGYMMASGEWRTSQPGGGSDPASYQAAYGVNPNDVRGVGQQDLPKQLNFNQLQQAALETIRGQGTQEMDRIVHDHQRPANQGAPVEIAPDMGGVNQRMADTHNKMFMQGGSKEQYMQQDKQMQQMMQMFMKMIMGGGMPPAGQ